MPYKMTALSVLWNLKCSKHGKPAPHFKILEDIFAEHFANLEQIKLAMLYRIVDKEKYKSVLDGVEATGNIPTYTELKDKLESYYYRRPAPHGRSRMSLVRAMAGGDGGCRVFGRSGRCTVEPLSHIEHCEWGPIPGLAPVPYNLFSANHNSFLQDSGPPA